MKNKSHMSSLHKNHINNNENLDLTLSAITIIGLLSTDIAKQI